jgi:16S rRNA (cytosine967-C5)-methyltransferase
LKLFPNLVRAVVAALQEIFDEGRYADKVIQYTLKSNPKWGSRDRAFIAENVYEIVRWYRWLYELDGRPPKNEADWWRLFGIRLLLEGHTLPSWTEFQSLHPEALLKRRDELQSIRKVRESIPDWLDELGEKELGEEWTPMLQALNEQAPVVLRVNRLKTSPEDLQEQLAASRILTESLGADALVVTRRRNLFTTESFKKGLFEVQGYSSQQVAPYLNVEPGMRVIDACAGGGGKTLHLATLMENKGQIIALDTEAWKLKELKKRARRNGAHIVETRPIESTKVIKRLANSADRVLLDVPCSGLGVIRRNPDAKWKLQPEFIDRIRATQQEILQSYSRMVKPGGRLVYATCSILPSENEQQVHTFLEQNDQFELLRDDHLWPHREGYDGFYMAEMERKG